MIHPLHLYEYAMSVQDDRQREAEQNRLIKEIESASTSAGKKRRRTFNLRDLFARREETAVRPAHSRSGC